MIQARRRFLERGHFEPLSTAINALAARPVAGRDSDGRELVAVEVGCGEGYYIGGLARSFAHALRDRDGCFFGVDLSKEALRVASRAHAPIVFFVNDVHHHLCFADGRVDLLLNVFAPRNAEEFERIVPAGGSLVVAIPRPSHLIELRGKLPLLGIEPEKRERTVDQLKGFELEEHQELVYGRTLDGREIGDLLRMTPNHWHIDEATSASVLNWDSVQITLAIDLLCFRRRNAAAVERT
jgi:23S rRNA (guanine745-N1)-methyltransferase